ncbi:MAG: trigger factor [Planctomycetes bacterium]|nr:trigger factor [Planctomycetota bacterium]
MDQEKTQENEPTPAPPVDDEPTGVPPSPVEEAVPPSPGEDEGERDTEDGRAAEASPDEGEEAAEEEEPLGAEAEIEEVDPCVRRLRIRVASEKVQEKLDKTYEELRKSAHVRGFRRGRVPRRYLERRFGTEIESELRDELLQRSFREVLEKHEFSVLGAPDFKDIEFKAGEPFTYVAELDVFPAFEPPTYEGLNVSRDEIPVTDEEVDAHLARLRDEAASLVPPPEGDETIQPSDHLVVAYRLLDGDKERFHRKRVQVIPERKVVDGIAVEDLVEGLKERTGPKRFKAKPPENFRDGHLAGREIEIEIDVLDVRRVHIPDLEGELPQHFGCQGLPELRDQVRAAIAAEKRGEAERRLEDRIIDTLAETADFPLPEKLVRAEALRKSEAAAEDAEPDPKVTAEVREDVKRRFLLIAIARKEGIEVADDEVRARIRQWEERFVQPSGALVKEMEKTADFERVRESLLLEKTRERLRRLNEAIGGEEAAPAPAPEEPPASPEGPASEAGGAPEGAGGQA